MISVKFHQDLTHRKTSLPELLCGVICVILYLAILIQYCDRQTHRQICSQRATAHTVL